MVSAVIILPVMFISIIIILMSPIKLSPRFACSMETIVYLLILLYSAILILIKEDVLENKLGL